MTSWTRSRAPSLASSRATCALAVAVLMTRRPAISPLDRPRPTRVRTSRSRSVTPGSSRGGSAGVGRRRRRRWPGELLDETAGDAGRDQRVARRDHADRGQDVLQRHVLDQEAARAGPQRGVHVIVIVERGEHDDPGRPGPGAPRRDHLGGLDAVHAGHPDVHDHHVGPGLPGELDRLGAGAGLADDVEVRAVGDEHAQARADQRLVVGKYDPNGHGYRPRAVRGHRRVMARRAVIGPPRGPAAAPPPGSRRRPAGPR